ncbi:MULTISPECIES: acyl-CoA dehydrogenase family protein [unclassified Streptomyces]|uniref:acyl-CoA dehydrogenase family protein n=1 Tax=unclassified Streptomyces TaxID=2593676 RepID=UPI002E2E7970|nr:acyl-CoA dehydrogenase family protein [Streptomyces sp. NBC_00223]
MTVFAPFPLDERLGLLRAAAADTGAELRSHALALDADPHDMRPHLGVAGYDLIRRCTTPPRYGAGPLRLGRYAYAAGSCLDQVVLVAELARGDAGMVLACPAPSLSGVLVDQMGDAAQREHFHRSLADGATWPFFAVTEPARGSDASAMETRLTPTAPDGTGPGDYRLTGVKRYIGNGARGALGVVFARTGRGPLSIRAVLLDAASPGFDASPLDMAGLRGTCLGEMRFDAVPVPRERLLGRHLSPARQGMWAAIRVFNQMRAQVGALAVGTATALLELVREERPDAPGAGIHAARIEACRSLVYAAGAAVDADRDASHPSSLAKYAATTLARDTARWAVRSLGQEALIDLPLLEKWTRDVGAFEFMEGTADIQRQHIAKAYLKGRYALRRTPPEARTPGPGPLAEADR